MNNGLAQIFQKNSSVKSILLLVLSFTTGSIFAQHSGASANATARVNAEIVAPISVTSEGAIDFGQIAANSDGGQVLLTPDGNRSASVDNILIPGRAASTAIFKVQAADGYSYSIAINADPLTTGAGSGSQTMDVMFELDQYQLTGNGQEQLIGLTSTLTVNPDQAAGEYTGEVTMTVSYE